MYVYILTSTQSHSPRAICVSPFNKRREKSRKLNKQSLGLLRTHSALQFISEFAPIHPLDCSYFLGDTCMFNESRVESRTHCPPARC